MTELKALRELCGKKLIWVGYDPKDEVYDLVFEGKLVIRIPEFVAVSGPDFIEKLLSERLADAENTVALRELTKAPPADPEEQAIIDKLDADINADTQGALDVGQEATQAPEVAQADASPTQCEPVQAEGGQPTAGPRPDQGAGGDAGASQVGEDACDSGSLPPL